MKIKPEKISITPEMKRSMAETKAEMDKWMEDPSFRAELDALEAECKAQDYARSGNSYTRRLPEGGTGMKIIEEDCLMEDVYETRRRISARCGNDPSVYIAFMRNEESLSRKAGLSFADYCLNKVTRVDAAHKKSTT